MITDDLPELSSMATAVGELSGRVERVAERYVDSPREDVANRLFEVERALRRAERVLEQLVRDAH
ncbi:MAG: hypothetical protein OEW42_07180 [Acidimicrobiia bacterium]|nr:hypothetical protein [Acidimicrobiia bacterium]MDH5236891.1 hypothetical protein [Acidimicrobiia bacterium]